MKDIFNSALFAIQFLTRIPVPFSRKPQEATARKALMLFPLVGWVLGAVLLCLYLLIQAAGACSALITAVLIVIAETVLTGAFHLDGLADTFDAFLSSNTSREQKLDIMKDSRIGVMGASALVLCLIFKIVLLERLLSINMSLAVCIYPVIGRWTQVAFYVFSPYIREEGLGRIFSQTADQKTLIAGTLWLLPCFVLLPILFPLILVVIFFYGYRTYVHKQINGITGDVLGSATVLSECVFLLALILITKY